MAADWSEHLELYGADGSRLFTFLLRRDGLEAARTAFGRLSPDEARLLAQALEPRTWQALCLADGPERVGRFLSRFPLPEAGLEPEFVSQLLAHGDLTPDLRAWLMGRMVPAIQRTGASVEAPPSPDPEPPSPSRQRG